ncbi:MAG: hypothetical protein ACOCWI_03915 [Bacillota bacterium]
MREIEYQGNKYLYFNGNFVEKDSYIIPTEDILIKLVKIYYSEIDYTQFNDKELKAFIKETKNNLAYNICLKASLHFYERKKEHSWEIRYILPIITSIYRKMLKPEKVIELNKKAYEMYGKTVFSVPLYTSIAAAYCDLNQYEKAKKFCHIAYAEQGGTTGYQTELTLVYNRIEKETRGD